jgi:glycosyltransferase involved in cell wall biosynthesis
VSLSPFTLGFVGRFEEEKGVRLFCEIALASKHEGLPFQYQLFGDGSLRDSIAAEFGSVVLCRGVEHDKDELFRQIDALVVTSRIENAPYAVLEAKARGIPVVSARIGGVPEIVEQGEDGIICESRSVASYLAAIKELFAQYEELRGGCLKNRSRYDFETLGAAMWAPLLCFASNTGLTWERGTHRNSLEQVR